MRLRPASAAAGRVGRNADPVEAVCSRPTGRLPESAASLYSSRQSSGAAAQSRGGANNEPGGQHQHWCQLSAAEADHGQSGPSSAALEQMPGASPCRPLTSSRISSCSATSWWWGRSAPWPWPASGRRGTGLGGGARPGPGWRPTYCTSRGLEYNAATSSTRSGLPSWSRVRTWPSSFPWGRVPAPG